MKNLLFITWDGPQTFYMEGLFMPIFRTISERENIRFHVMQFTWADEIRTVSTRKAAEKMGIYYTAEKVYRKPIASIGSFLTVQSGAKKIKAYIRQNKIDVVMPRSTFPAMMVNAIGERDFQLIFDADGLPIEERIDFSGLKRGSFLFNWMKSAETKMLKKADAVITRSEKAIEIHLNNIGETFREKFSVVSNGRDKYNFRYCRESRVAIRKELGIDENCLLFIYVGSLGGKYALKEMLQIFEKTSVTKPSKFLILTGDDDYVRNYIGRDDANIFIKRVKGTEVYRYISAANIGFALIYPSFSMQAAVPTKLGEYLLCGLPTIASRGIGDSETILQEFENCYLFSHDEELQAHLPAIKEFTEKATFADRNAIREKALTYFSLEAAAESYIEAIAKLK